MSVHMCGSTYRTALALGTRPQLSQARLLKLSSLQGGDGSMEDE